jgi:hypothetical protein
MATSKAAKKTAKKAARKVPGKGPHPLYGRPIDQVIKRGDLAEMRRVGAQARKYLKDVQTALKALDQKIGKAG